MSGSAAMALLKKPGKGKVTAPTPPPLAEVEADEEATQVDIETMDAAEIDALVKEHSIETPKTWGKMNLDKKKAWLTEQFSTEDATEGAAETAEAEAGAEEPAATPPAAEEPVAKPKATITKVTKPPAAPKTAAAANGKAGTAVATTNAKSGKVETPGEDQIVDIAHEIENLDEADARATVVILRETSEQAFFRLGGVLARIQANGWYEPYSSLREYVEQEHGLNYRRAMYYIEIYNKLVESGVAWAKVSHLGWTKLQAIAPIITPKNVNKWATLAGKSTVLQLHEAVRLEKAALLEGTKPPSDDPDEAKTVTTRTFKLHNDQKEIVAGALKKAREQAGTDSDSAALEFICLDFMGGEGNKLSAHLSKLGLDKALDVFAEAYPDANLQMAEATG